MSQEGKPQDACKTISGTDSEVSGDHSQDVSGGKWQTAGGEQRLAVRTRQGV